MKISGTHYRTIWAAADGTVQVIDQSRLPFEFVVLDLATVDEAADAIRCMAVRGAPLIGVTAAYGMALAMRADPSDASLQAAASTLQATRPTAVNLAWAIARLRRVLTRHPPPQRAAVAWREAAAICEEDVACSKAIGEHGRRLIQGLSCAAHRTVNILTHCNAGWLAAVDWGTALAPVYAAHDAGCAVHVWVDETRPRNQGAALTAFELGAHGIPHTVIVDNAGGHLMHRGLVDLVLVGSDRVTAAGDICNKIGTYLKALAAGDNGVPFYAAMPSSTIDWGTTHGGEIPIEERSPDEVTHVTGSLAAGGMATVRVVPHGSAARNPAFDVTPARLVTGIITERGVCAATAAGLRELFPQGEAA